MEPNPECGPDGATPNSGHRVLPLFGALVELRLDYVSPWERAIKCPVFDCPAN